MLVVESKNPKDYKAIAMGSEMEYSQVVAAVVVVATATAATTITKAVLGSANPTVRDSLPLPCH